MSLSRFVSVAPGLEGVPVAERSVLGFKARARPGGVEVQGDLSAGWTLPLAIRVAHRRVLTVGSVRGASPAAITYAMRGIEWARWVDPA